MSYDLFCVAGALPKTFRTALRKYDLLIESDDLATNSSPVANLISVIVEKYATFTSIRADTPARHKEVLLNDGTCHSLHLTLNWGSPISEIVNTINAHGYSVIDAQTEDVFISTVEPPPNVTADSAASPSEEKDLCHCAELSLAIRTLDDAHRCANKFAGLSKKLTLLHSSPRRGANLYRCKVCSSLVQSGSLLTVKPYYFSVPTISVDQWKRTPWVDPVDAEHYKRIITTYIARATEGPSGLLVKKRDVCRIPACTQEALSVAPLCIAHQIQSLIKAGGLPPAPKGKWFEPYKEIDYVPDIASK